MPAGRDVDRRHVLLFERDLDRIADGLRGSANRRRSCHPGASADEDAVRRPVQARVPDHVMPLALDRQFVIDVVFADRAAVFPKQGGDVEVHVRLLGQ